MDRSGMGLLKPRGISGGSARCKVLSAMLAHLGHLRCGRRRYKSASASGYRCTPCSNEIRVSVLMLGEGFSGYFTKGIFIQQF